MHILNKDTFEQRRTGEHSGVTSLDRDLGDRRLLPDAADYSRFFATRYRDAHYFHAGSDWEDYEPA